MVGITLTALRHLLTEMSYASQGQVKAILPHNSAPASTELEYRAKFWATHFKKNVNILERIQRTETKNITSVKGNHNTQRKVGKIGII